jgi:hypothetical protein
MLQAKQGPTKRKRRRKALPVLGAAGLSLSLAGAASAAAIGGRVEDRRGSLGHLATPRFPSSLIEPDVPISGIRLSDWFHRRAHDGAVNGRRSRRKRPRSP